MGSYKREDGSCSATVLNFDLPFAMALHHGQVLVKIEGQMPIEAIIKLHGIEDTGKNFIHREEHNDKKRTKANMTNQKILRRRRRNI